MKSLLDIQLEIRELKGKIKDISESLSGIYEEIDDLRNDETETIDYEMIQLMSTHLNFGKHPLDELEDGDACLLYLEALINLMQIDNGAQSSLSRLVFIQWILTQSRLDMSLEELYKDTLKINSTFFGELVEFIPKNYRDQLVMDALIIANICGQANKDILIYVIDLCNILGVNKEQLRILSIIAKGILKQDLGKMKRTDLQQILAQAKSYKHYLNADLLNAALRSQRTLVVEAPDKTYSNFKWKVKQQGQVETGDIVATYGNGKWSGSSLTEITAPCSGTLFQFRNNCINYGVIAHESDNKDSIKAWAIQRR